MISTHRFVTAIAALLLIPSFASAQCDPVQVWNQWFQENNSVDPIVAPSSNLEDHQVTIEVQFLSVSRNFFDRIGIDFNVNINNNSQCPTPPINPIPGVPFPNTSFDNSQAINPLNPLLPFDPVNPEGTTFGLAILSDIEAFFFLQAAQADRRTNLMQAPKVTLFNGQTGKVADGFRTTFGGNQFIASGVTLSLLPQISGDQQYVQMTIMPTLAGIARTQNFDSVGGQLVGNGGNLPQIQQPVIAPIVIGTTVTVPDGGTILLGGLKGLGDGPQGAPILSAVPYVSRLFRNAGVGHTDSLMLMVTPRIIIQEEEEE